MHTGTDERSVHVGGRGCSDLRLFCTLTLAFIRPFISSVTLRQKYSTATIHPSSTGSSFIDTDFFLAMSVYHKKKRQIRCFSTVTPHSPHILLNRELTNYWTYEINSVRAIFKHAIWGGRGGGSQLSAKSCIAYAAVKWTPLKHNWPVSGVTHACAHGLRSSTRCSLWSLLNQNVDISVFTSDAKTQLLQWCVYKP